MYFNRLFGSGLDNSSDPRDKIFAEFKCALCGENSEIDVTYTHNTFDYNKERRCPHCRVISAEDKETNLENQLEKLTSDKNRIQIEIEKCIRELDDLHLTSATGKNVQ